MINVMSFRLQSNTDGPAVETAAPGRWPTVPLRGRQVKAKAPSPKGDGWPAAWSREFNRWTFHIAIFAVCLFNVALAPLVSHAQDTTTLQAPEPPPNAIWVESLDLGNMSSQRGVVRAGHSTGDKPLTLNKVVYPHGIGTHVDSQMTLDLKGAATRFVSLVGVDDETNKRGEIEFKLLVDGKTAANAVLKGGDPPKLLSVDLTGAHSLVMAATTPSEKANQWDIYSNGNADWAGAMLLLAPDAKERPASVDFSILPAAFKFPAIAPATNTPTIHGPLIMGASPQHPFLYGVPVTGQAPITFAATGLPTGLNLDAQSGLISGQIATPGTYHAQLRVTNAAGKATRSLTIICDDHKLALTPPMGWSAWNVFGENVTASKVREQVDWLVNTGLAAHGYQYVLVDDTWQSRRDSDGTIGANKRFGNMKALIDYVHSKGLKFGIYSSPTAQTCSGYAGSAGHEQQDAATYTSWGVDYLKYDWCDPPSNKATTKDADLRTAYRKMRTALDGVNRDIVYAINVYGWGKPWEWGADVGANSWWTSSLIIDKWGQMHDNGFNQQSIMQYAGAGHWNDPGWLEEGRLGFAAPRFTHLTLAEQMTQVSLWSLMAAPLLISCDLHQLDPNPLCPITTAVLTNDEVLDIDQDALGQPATRIGGIGDMEIWARPLADGTKAVGLFNKKEWAQELEIPWSDLGLSGAQPVRDLWQHQDLGLLPRSFKSLVPAHGVVLLKVGQAQPAL